MTFAKGGVPHAGSRQRVPSWVASPSFWRGPREGTTESGLRRGAPLAAVGLPSRVSAPETEGERGEKDRQAGRDRGCWGSRQWRRVGRAEGLSLSKKKGRGKPPAAPVNGLTGTHPRLTCCGCRCTVTVESKSRCNRDLLMGRT